uniref:Uncharacterized protein n=1 Tax=Chromera velia CCMP2878 TaxID=1169474 RepID=A0A0G4IC33_9ALVE|eukprot:Cvel_13027.t1-p1 / transcript=Cvel_13027.t1 / gene=Cvel_13027 / organism=Chromera_velia_CCMP2878 / gene_product=hypothetical protein / transcript_product=hypothetical protein / location=Cvel_scaffold874:55409-56953(-) / protein_length=515 / sequence_SO=supercontig / SO=protein_coding / is_pseudo=false
MWSRHQLQELRTATACRLDNATKGPYRPRKELKDDDGIADLDKWLNQKVILTNAPPGSAKHKGRVTACADHRSAEPVFTVTFPDETKENVSQSVLRLPVNCLTNQVLKILLLGSLRPSSPLSALRTPGGLLLHRISLMIIDGWNDQISHRPKAEGLLVTPKLRDLYLEGRRGWLNERSPPTDDRLQPAFVVCHDMLEFPPFTGDVRVNMLPIRMGDEKSLPKHLRAYQKLIDMCPIHPSERGKIGYLTVHESEVGQGETQRRGGLHTEKMGGLNLSGEKGFSPAIQHHWGIGLFHYPDVYVGGLYIANSVDNSCEVFDAVVGDDIIGPLGDLEHVRDLLGKTGTPIQSGQLVWMTDRTPHGALPQPKSGRRQFFRLVAGPVSHWFADHSTANPLVPLPDDVQVVRGDKFMMVGQTWKGKESRDTGREEEEGKGKKEGGETERKLEASQQLSAEGGETELQLPGPWPPVSASSSSAAASASADGAAAVAGGGVGGAVPSLSFESLQEAEGRFCDAV